MVVIVIVGLLAGLEVSNTRHSSNGHRRDIVTLQIREIENALDIYYKHNGFFPTTEQGLEALVIKPTTDPQPKEYLEGGYMKKIPLDPWGNPFIYRCHGEKGPIDIISCGPDGEEDTEDDITNINEEIKTP
jgi:general secretion pathway protein G